MRSYKLTNLTNDNIKALRAAMEIQPLADGESLELTKRTATFTMANPYGWLVGARIDLGERDGRRAGPYAALHTVIRKLVALIKADLAGSGVQIPTDPPQSLSEILRLD